MPAFLTLFYLLVVGLMMVMFVTANHFARKRGQMEVLAKHHMVMADIYLFLTDPELDLETRSSAINAAYEASSEHMAQFNPAIKQDA